MTLRHGKIQLRPGRYWDNYKNIGQQSVQIYTDVSCRNNK